MRKRENWVIKFHSISITLHFRSPFRTISILVLTFGIFPVKTFLLSRELLFLWQQKKKAEVVLRTWFWRKGETRIERTLHVIRFVIFLFTHSLTIPHYLSSIPAITFPSPGAENGISIRTFPEQNSRVLDPLLRPLLPSMLPSSILCYTSRIFPFFFPFVTQSMSPHANSWSNSQEQKITVNLHSHRFRAKVILFQPVLRTVFCRRRKRKTNCVELNAKCFKIKSRPIFSRVKKEFGTSQQKERKIRWMNYYQIIFTV